MANQKQKFYKTKYAGVFYRHSARRDPRTGEVDRIYYFWWQDADGKGHWKQVGRHSKGERPQTAHRARLAFLADLASGKDPVKRESLTVGDTVDAYVLWAQSEGKHIAQPLQQYDKHLRARLHAVPVSAITAGMLSRIKADLAATPVTLRTGATPKKERSQKPRTLSAQTIAHLFSFCRRAVNRAISTGEWSGSNPFASRQYGAWQMPKVDNRRLRFFSPSEASLLLSRLAISSQQLHDMALLSLRTGLRATEIFKLRAQDIDAHAGILHVISKGGHVDSVPAPEEVIEMLMAYGRSGEEPIFQERESGQPIKRISDAFRRAVDDLGLDTSNGDSRFSVTFHTLRHTFASWLAQSGKVSLFELKTLMRHKSFTMTQRYAHLIPGQERKKLEIINKLLEDTNHG